MLILPILYSTTFMINSKLIILIRYAPVAQLDRALGYGPGGSGFKS